DLYVNDSNGTTNNGVLGNVKIQSLVPTGAGSSTQFTPTSGSNWQTVSDNPDVASSYNSDSTVGHRDTYVMSDLLASTGSGVAVQDNIHAFRSDAGTGTLKGAMKSGATVFYDTTQNLSASNLWYGQIRETDPNTSATWTVSNVNALEYGAEVV